MTDEEVLQVLRNVGVDTSCGACAEVAFTGSAIHEHTCDSGRGRPILSIDPGRDSGCVLPDESGTPQATARVEGQPPTAWDRLLQGVPSV